MVAKAFTRCHDKSAKIYALFAHIFVSETIEIETENAKRKNECILVFADDLL